MSDYCITEMKGCPFCGHQPKVFQLSNEHGGGIFTACSNSCCALKPSLTTENREQAVTFWNTRYNEEQPNGQN